VIKTRYLADVAGHYKSIPDCVIQLARSEGIKGFFKVRMYKPLEFGQ
jgi:hypothetical protein